MKSKNRKLSRPYIREGWLSIILSLFVFILILLMGLVLTSKSITTFLSLIPAIFPFLLVYFYGLRTLSRTKENSDKYYSHATKMSFLVLFLIYIIYSICFFNLK